MVLKKLMRSTLATLVSATTVMITVAAIAVLVSAVTAQPATAQTAITYDAASALPIDSCPGYTAKNVVRSATGLTADLKLAGPACNTYGVDLDNLKLVVEYQSEARIHVKIFDAEENVYQVPESVLPRPGGSINANNSSLEFVLVEKPFGFSIKRKGSREALFDTTNWDLIFQSQYLRLRTALPDSPHLYGLGEHTDSLMLNTTNYTRTLWSRDAYSIPSGTNLYGNHPVYYDNRGDKGTHGVFLLNSNGMDVKINTTKEDGQYLEYNVLGGVFDLYFLAGPSPKEVSKQYAQVVGLPAMQAYWTLGFHQCKYGYPDAYYLAEVVANYSAAGIPLETAWLDIDYMYRRRVFTLDPERFAIDKIRALVSTLHDRKQHFIVMVDPAVAYQDYPAFNNGVALDVFLKTENGSVFKGVVWPGVTAFPDWFAPNTQRYWNDEFSKFFDASTGADIDGLWIDMNEPANFCSWPCTDPEGVARAEGNPPPAAPLRSSRPSIPGFPAVLQPTAAPKMVRRQSTGRRIGLPGRNLVAPPYKIQNAAGSLSNKTVFSDLIHHGGYAEYDVHNLYGTMMSTASRTAMLNRRPGRRPLVITRSTFAGAGKDVGHWLGDNISKWEHYRISIAQLLSFAAFFQVPMVGSDVCGFGGNTTSTLCARWAMLGAFSTFYRNHAEINAIYQEFYRWPVVAEAARVAINARYRLLDYIYTGLRQQSLDGTPVMNPLFFLYPKDKNTFQIDLQYFYGDSILVSPVTEENSTSVNIYLPDDLFYDFWTHEPVRGAAKWLQLDNVNFTSIPLHIKGGSIIPLRSQSGSTTAELRTRNFELVIAPGLDNRASGSLYMDDGDAIAQPLTSNIHFTYDNGKFDMTGSFDYPATVSIVRIALLSPGTLAGGVGKTARRGTLVHDLSIPLTQPFSMTL